jgi:hypothetical protein
MIRQRQQRKIYSPHGPALGLNQPGGFNLDPLEPSSRTVLRRINYEMGWVLQNGDLAWIVRSGQISISENEIRERLRIMNGNEDKVFRYFKSKYPPTPDAELVSEHFPQVSPIPEITLHPLHATPALGRPPEPLPNDERSPMSEPLPMMPYSMVTHISFFMFNNANSHFIFGKVPECLGSSEGSNVGDIFVNEKHSRGKLKRDSPSSPLSELKRQSVEGIGGEQRCVVTDPMHTFLPHTTICPLPLNNSSSATPCSVVWRDPCSSVTASSLTYASSLSGTCTSNDLSMQLNIFHCFILEFP